MLNELNSLTSDGVLKDDSFSIFVPIEDHDLIKSVEVDENGDYIVQGVMTSEDKDEEDDSIDPEGTDCSYLLDKGWIKYEHGNNPAQFIGEPIDVKVGQFKHPTLDKLVKGVFVRGRLFAQRELARQAVQTIQDLEKSHTKRKMGWSIEGSVRERDRKTGKVIKSIVRNVVLTMNPINTMTWAELAKSFSGHNEVTVSMEMPKDSEVNKALDVDGMEAIDTQSLEGAPHVVDKSNQDEDGQTKWIRLFRKFIREHLMDKSLFKQFVAGTEGSAGMQVYDFALNEGLDNEEAFEFASYMTGRHEILKSLFKKISGGEKMAKSTQSALAELLDTEVEELEKSLNGEDEDKKEETNNKKEKGKNTKGENQGNDENDDNEDHDEDDNEEEKSLKTDFAKSFADNEENAKAFEVSDFLQNLVDEIGYNIEGFQKSLNAVASQQSTMTRSLIAFSSLVKSLTEKIESVTTENAELKKSLDELLEKPVGRRSVVSAKEVQTLAKSQEAGKQSQITRSQAMDVLMKAFDSKEITGMTVSRFESGVPLNRLDLPDSVKTKLGM
jgi:hypothetical protein